MAHLNVVRTFSVLSPCCLLFCSHTLFSPSLTPVSGRGCCSCSLFLSPVFSVSVLFFWFPPLCWLAHFLYTFFPSTSGLEHAVMVMASKRITCAIRYPNLCVCDGALVYLSRMFSDVQRLQPRCSSDSRLFSAAWVQRRIIRTEAEAC